MLKKCFAFLILFIIVFLPAIDDDVWTTSLDKMSSLLELIKKNYHREFEYDKGVYASIRGMLHTLDPHSYFLDPESFSRMQEDYRGKYFGLGILIQKQEDRLVVISPIEGGPASRLGIQAGDIISHIEGKSTKPISSLDAVHLLRGPKGKPVNITIVREGLDEPLELTVVRDEIPLHSVPYSFMLTEDTGYIFIRNFAETTTDEFEGRIRALEIQGMKRLILDMRGNSGGTFLQALEISDEFLARGDQIVSIRGRNKGYNREFFAVRDEQYENLPLVILINQGSASAPEIVAGAVKDNDRGIIVGQNSWGKGLVQTVFPLSPNTAVALTTAKYFTPSGRSIQKYSSVDNYVLHQAVPEEEREVRYTAKGRKVLGQGGIAPDYEVDFLYSNITASLVFRGRFFTYAQKFVNGETPLSKTLLFPSNESESSPGKQGKININRGFKVGQRVVEDFRNFLTKGGFEFSQKDFTDAEEEIKRELEREIYSSYFGIEEGIRVFRKNDPVVLKAIEVFSEAAALVRDR
ncbi:MAG: S41 family peptidase [Candidatus Aminicenantes bacterium]|nr:S41 family peptidase [Candidatus Aminicenantes bacterium]